MELMYYFIYNSKYHQSIQFYFIIYWKLEHNFYRNMVSHQLEVLQIINLNLEKLYL